MRNFAEDIWQSKKVSPKYNDKMEIIVKVSTKKLSVKRTVKTEAASKLEDGLSTCPTCLTTFLSL